MSLGNRSDPFIVGSGTGRRAGNYSGYNEPDYIATESFTDPELLDPEIEESIIQETTVFRPVPAEIPGGGRIKDKKSPHPSALVTVTGIGGNQIPLHRHAADAWTEMVKSARLTGIQHPVLLPTSGYRSPERQQRLWKAALEKYKSPEIARRWVAPPGGSPHQTGRAIDLYLGSKNSSENVPVLRNLPAYRWLASNAVRFGFYPYEREPWHWEYNPPYAATGLEDYPLFSETLPDVESFKDVEVDFPSEIYPDLESIDIELEPEIKTTVFYRDLPTLQQIPLKPSLPVKVIPSWPSKRKAIAWTYNRIGGLMRALAGQAAIKVQAALAVWYVESAGRKHMPGKAIIRFENHLFYKLWGKFNEDIYNKHFRHGGHAGQPGEIWLNHQFRENENAPFKAFHGNQVLEYKVLIFATKLCKGDEGILSISIGGPQILISNYRTIGYATPKEMYDAFQASERSHVLGFFDFCNQRSAPKKGDLITYLRQQQWNQFARYYNGKGQVEKYGGLIQNSYQHAQQVIA